MADTAHYQTDLKLEEMEKRLSAIYSRAEKEIQNTADEYFSKFAKQDEAKRKLLEKGKITEEEYTKWRKGKVMYSKRFAEMKEQCAKQLLNVNQTALAYVNGELPEVYAINYNALESAVDGVGGYSFTLVDADTVRNLAVTDTSLLPYKKIDPAKDIPWNMKKINAETLQGILQGESMDKIAKRIMNVQEMNKTQAIRSARTIVTGAENKGRQYSYARAEADGIILQKEWVSTNDGRTRHSHAMLDGAIVDQDKKFENGLMFPGDPSGRPEEVYNCRCTLVAKVNGFKKAQVQKAMAENKEVKVKTAEFIPAKTVDEAEEYALKFVDQNRSKWSGNVSFKGISVESANTINKTLDELYSTGRLPKLRNIKPMNFRENIWKGSEEAPMAYRNMGDGDLYFNPRILKNKKTIDKYFLDGEKAYRFCVENIDKVPESKRHLVETYIKAGRSLVAQSADDKLSAVVHHEIGHHIQNQIIWKDKNAAQIVNDGFEKYSVQISGYATKTKGEYIAESFCSFKNGESEKIDPKLLEFFEGIV